MFEWKSAFVFLQWNYIALPVSYFICNNLHLYRCHSYQLTWFHLTISLCQAHLLLYSTSTDSATYRTSFDSTLSGLSGSWVAPYRWGVSSLHTQSNFSAFIWRCINKTQFKKILFVSAILIQAEDTITVKLSIFCSFSKYFFSKLIYPDAQLGLL